MNLSKREELIKFVRDNKEDAKAVLNAIFGMPSTNGYFDTDTVTNIKTKEDENSERSDT